jgi:hypothetical protein
MGPAARHGDRISTAARLTADAMLALAALLAVAATASAQRRAEPPVPAFTAGAFRGGPVDNPLFPLRPGMVWVLAVNEGGRPALDSITVTRETRLVAGVTAVVVHDRVLRGGVVAEDTYDWYAQDTSGTVWYLGEDTREFRNGRVASTSGSWEADVAGARAGILMMAHPKVGDAYRQEYRPGVAEDMGRVLSVDDTVTVPAGHFIHCVTTEDWSPLEPAVRERKTYCPGIGVVREMTVAGGRERSELLSVRRP